MSSNDLSRLNPKSLKQEDSPAKASDDVFGNADLSRYILKMLTSGRDFGELCEDVKNFCMLTKGRCDELEWETACNELGFTKMDPDVTDLTGAKKWKATFQYWCNELKKSEKVPGFSLEGLQDNPPMKSDKNEAIADLYWIALRNGAIPIAKWLYKHNGASIRAYPFSLWNEYRQTVDWATAADQMAEAERNEEVARHIVETHFQMPTQDSPLWRYLDFTLGTQITYLSDFRPFESETVARECMKRVMMEEVSNSNPIRVRFMLDLGVPAYGPIPGAVVVIDGQLMPRSEYMHFSFENPAGTTPLETAKKLLATDEAPWPYQNEMEEIIEMLQEAQEKEIDDFLKQQQASSLPAQ